MSAHPGAVSVAANVKDLLQYLSYRAERVQLPALDLGEQAPQLRIVGHRVLEMPLGPRGRDREHLAGEIARPPLLELPELLEVGAVRPGASQSFGQRLRVASVSTIAGFHSRSLPSERIDRTSFSIVFAAG